MRHPLQSPADPLLATLQRLLAISESDLGTAISQCCDAVVDTLAPDKVDGFLYEESRDSLVAVGTSTQPLSSLQKRLGLDVLPLSNGGRAVQVFRTGKSFLCGRVADDAEELLGIREGLRVRSEIAVPIEVDGTRSGVLMLASLKDEFFTEKDLAFTESIAKWVGVVAHRAELVRHLERNSIEHGRRAAAEELVTVLAHDLRNYLQPVQFRLQLLRRQMSLEGHAGHAADVEGALEGLRRLSSLISNILDVARIDRGLFDMKFEPLDITQLLHESARLLSTPEHQVSVRAPDWLVVDADPVQLRQAIDNVISNAVKFSPGSAPVSVHAELITRDSHEWVKVEVMDEGPGIPEDVLPHVFDRFATAEPGRGGLGLGLYLAKRIASFHGGELTAEPGKGARFSLLLPVAVGNRSAGSQ